MDLNALTAISPVDGRYWNQCKELSDYFSESSLIRYRLRVEVEYFIALHQPLKGSEPFRGYPESPSKNTLLLIR